MSREFNKSNVDFTMRKVRMDNAIRQIKSEVLTSTMDISKKIDFITMARMMSESGLGRIPLHSDNPNVQERAGITEVSETPKVGIIRRYVDPETHEYNEDVEHMAPEELIDYALPRIEKSKLENTQTDLFYEAVRKQINGQLSKTRLTDNDRLLTEGITWLVTTSPNRRLATTDSESIGIATNPNSVSGREEYVLAVYRKYKDQATGKIKEETLEKSPEDILVYALPRLSRETMEEGRKMAIKERAEKKINKDIEDSSLPEEKKTELKAVLQMSLLDSLSRVDIKSSSPHAVERVGVIFGDDARLAVIRRFRDPETGAGEEQILDMPIEELSKYIETRIPEASKVQEI